MKFFNIGLLVLLFISGGCLFSMELEDSSSNDIEMKEIGKPNHFNNLSNELLYTVVERYLNSISDDEPELYQASQKLLITNKRFTEPVLYFLQKKFESKKLSKLHIAVQLNAMHWILDYIRGLQATIKDPTEIKKLLSCTDEDGHTPLLYAVINSNKDIADLLIDNGAKFYPVIKSNNWWKNPSGWGLHLKAPNGKYEDFLVDLCGIHKAEMATYFDPDLDPVFTLAKGVTEKAMKLLPIDKLFQRMVQFERLIKGDLDPVSHALLIKYYLKNKLVDVNDIHFSKLVKGSPLMSAASKLKYKTMKVLIHNGADVNLQDDNGDTALVYALLGYYNSTHSESDFIKYLKTERVLLKNGADVDIKNRQGLAIADWASGRGFNGLASYFMGVKILEAIKRGNFEAVQQLVSQGAVVDARGESGNTPLHSAVFIGKQEIVDYLIAHGADINAQGKDGNTPLHSAVLMGNQEIIDYLIAHGADVTIENDDDLTPFDLRPIQNHQSNSEVE